MKLAVYNEIRVDKPNFPQNCSKTENDPERKLIEVEICLLKALWLESSGSIKQRKVQIYQFVSIFDVICNKIWNAI